MVVMIDIEISCKGQCEILSLFLDLVSHIGQGVLITAEIFIRLIQYLTVRMVYT